MASNALWTKRGIVHVVSGTGLVRFPDKSDGMRRPVSRGCDTLPMKDVL